LSHCSKPALHAMPYALNNQIT